MTGRQKGNDGPEKGRAPVSIASTTGFRGYRRVGAVPTHPFPTISSHHYDEQTVVHSRPGRHTMSGSGMPDSMFYAHVPAALRRNGVRQEALA